MRSFSVGALITLASFAHAAQIPLRAESYTSKPPVARGNGFLNWRFDQPLWGTNTTSNLIFDGVGSLLQQWAGTRYRNGHSIVPATVPIGTLLYHGTWRNTIPTTPEWLATDPEHSYLFCRELEVDSGCWHLTLAATRPLKVLYFDGSSASKMHGCMDTQDLIIWGDVRDERIYFESKRIDVLCEWGKKYGLDGFLRMEPDFEIMMCDFTNGLEVVSFSNIVPGWPKRIHRGAPPPPHQPSAMSKPDGWPLGIYRTIEAGKWHDRFPGETRVQLDLSRAISFYDPEMFPSVVSRHTGQPRWEHRVGNITQEERKRFMGRLDEVLTSEAEGSGVDWSTVYRVVVHRYAERLEVLQYILNGTDTSEKDTPDTIEETLSQVYDYLKTMMFPYLLHDARPPSDSSSEIPSLSWASPILEKCATTHTHTISKTPGLTYSEKLLLRAVNDVLHEICRVTIGIWAKGIELGLDKQDAQGAGLSFQDRTSPGQTVEEWREEINKLISWLDWSVWVKCRPACSFEETCYLPTWPWLRRGMLPFPTFPPPGKRNHRDFSPWTGLHDLGHQDEKEDDEDDMYWKLPQPRCILRVPPLEAP